MTLPVCQEKSKGRSTFGLCCRCWCSGRTVWWRLVPKLARSGYRSTGSVVEGMKKQLQKGRELRERYEEIKGECLISKTENWLSL